MKALREFKRSRQGKIHQAGDSPSRRFRGTSRALAVTLFAAGLLAFAPAALAQRSAALSLNVTFSFSGDIAVTLPDGTPVGTTKGAPTVIPAGFYSVLLSQPGCAQLFYFQLSGPGVNVLSNLEGGEMTEDSDFVNFMPNSTYTWTSDGAPTVIHTFVTSGQVLGTPPPAVTPTPTPKVPLGLPGNRLANSGVVGSGIVAARGSLTGAVSPTGKLTLARNGKPVKQLTAGRYKITITDKSSQKGFLLENAKHAAVTVTDLTFVGKKTVSVNLTAGKWFFASSLAAKQTSSIVVK